MALSHRQVLNAKPGARPYKLADGAGMYLLVKPSGSKLWRLKYRIAGREKSLALGVFPWVSLQDARNACFEARAKLARGIDPCAERAAAKRARTTSPAASPLTFSTLAEGWLCNRDAAPSTLAKDRWLLDAYLLPELGPLGIEQIKPATLLTVLEHIVAMGKVTTAQRSKILAGQVFDYGMRTGKCETNPVASLRRALRSPRVRHHPAVTDPRKLGELLRAIDGFTGQFSTRAALRLAPLVFVRPGELRHAEWSEIDLGEGVWRVPAAKMKMKAPHLVPLSRQAVGILSEIYPLTGHGRFVFPSLRSASRPMSENTLNAALRRLGYGPEEMTAHGFRSTAATLLNEMGWNPDAIERQLAHAESNKVRAAYTHAAQYLSERKEMMQAWADHLDYLRNNLGQVPGGGNHRDPVPTSLGAA